MNYVLFKAILTLTFLLPASTFVFAADKIPTPPTAFIPSSPVPTMKKPATKIFSFPSHKSEHISAFAGKISPILSKLYVTPEKAKNVITAIKFVTEPADLVFIILIGWFLLPLVQLPYDKLYLSRNTEGDDAVAEKTVTTATPVKVRREFKATKLYFYTHLIAEAGRIAGLVYLVDCLAIALEVLGFNVQNHSKICAKTIYTAWAFTRINGFKKFLVARAFRYNGPDEKRRKRAFNRTHLVNNIFNLLICGGFISTLLDVLKIKAGLFLNSFFAVGGAGTLVLSFACKDLAMQVSCNVCINPFGIVGSFTFSH
jgi:small-conductance mechanosensitive channel